MPSIDKHPLRIYYKLAHIFGCGNHTTSTPNRCYQLWCLKRLIRFSMATKLDDITLCKFLQQNVHVTDNGEL